MSNPLNAKIETVVADASDLRSQVSALATIVAAQNAQIATLANAAQAALAPRTRAAKADKAGNPAMSREASLCAACGFNKEGPRKTLFLALLAKGEGVYPLTDFPDASLADAQVVYRRISGNRTNGRISDDKSGIVGFTLAIDNETRGHAVLIVTSVKSGEKSEASAA